MFKFVASLCVALGLVAFAPMPAQALPVSTCAPNGTFDGPGPNANELLTCNLFDDPTQEQVTVADPFGTVAFPPDWFTPSYAILIDSGDGSNSDVVAFTRVVPPAGGPGFDQVTLYSEGSGGFANALAAALAAPANALTRVQENAAGVTTFFVNFQSGTGASSAFAGCNGAANCDTINVTSPENAGQPSAVPEPATLTLMGLAGAVAAIRRRRKATV
jgi:hypothetical protein